MVQAFWLVADEGITQTQALYGAIGLIVSGLLTFAGVVFTAMWQRSTADRAAATEKKISTFEEQDRLLERERQRADRAEARVAVVEAENDRIRRDRDDFRRRTRVAEDKVEKWIERNTP